MNRKITFASILTVVLLLFITSFFLGHSLPLYDGVAFPDEPYRYVEPPSNSLKTKLPPLGSQVDSSVQTGYNKDNVSIATDESGSQAASYFIPGSLLAPTNATKITITITPLAPNKSTDSKVVGNIYRFNATSDTGTVTLVTAVSNIPAISLRLPQGHPRGAIMIYRDRSGDPWNKLATDRIGEDIYSATAQGLGDYALIDSPTATATPKSITSDPTRLVTTIALLIALVGVILLLVIIRFTIRKKHRER